MPLNVARDYLVENQGRQFDPACVEAFLSRWDEVVEIAAGQQATPYQKTEATLAPVTGIESAAEATQSRPSQPNEIIHPANSLPAHCFLRSPV
jgi:putative two-component system response regulator